MEIGLHASIYIPQIKQFQRLILPQRKNTLTNT